ncbi:MAG TPA: hypothetical protein VK144_05160 [Bacillota bacterium]|nr:hypothetical protein [Bacillota bacterium]
MTALEELMTLTMRLHELFFKQNISQNRDYVIQEIDRLLDERSHIIPLLEAPTSTEETKQVEAFMKLNQETEHKMQSFLEDLKHDMHSSKLQRKSNLSYINPYNHIQAADGMYVDRKN